MTETVTRGPGSVGTALPRREDDRLLRGRARYVDDLVLPGMLHARLVRCPYPHARIAGVDVAATSGAFAALAAADLAGEWAAPLPMIWPLTEDILVPEHWPLAPQVARHEGDPVAVVLAESAAAAEDAAAAVRVEWEELPAVVAADAALAPDAALVHPELGSNRCYVTTYARGDVDAAFARADVVVERTFRLPRIAPTALEGRACLAAPEGDGFVLYTSSQVPHIVRRTLAPCVGIPEHRLRVVAPDVGGAFGGKLNVYAEEAIVVALARRFGRPVKWVEGRAESFVATGHGRGQVQRVAFAATADGRLIAVRAHVVVGLGAYLQLETPGIPVLGQFAFGGAYRADAYSFTCTGVFTNETSLGSYRGVGRAEAAYAAERMIDELAAELRLDPVEVRRRNFVPPGQLVENAAGIRLDAVDFDAVLDEVLVASGYDALRAERATATGPRRLGIGLAVFADTAGAGPSAVLRLMRYQGGGWESARVRVLSGGSVEVFPGTSPQGQGHETAYAQIAADVFGISPEQVEVVAGDTATSPPGVGTFSSRGISVGGTAVHLAAERALAKARRIAAHLLEAGEDELAFADGVFGDGARSLTIAEVATAAWLGYDLPPGLEPGLEELVVHDPAGFTTGFGAHVAVVSVDTETGEVRVVRYVAVDDCGRVVNPLLAAGQLHGGLAQGIAQALYEEVAYGDGGSMTTGSLVEYVVPGATELPWFETSLRETPSPLNPLGAKGIAEAGAIGAPPAVMNAILDALRPLGVRELDLPATPERIWRALRLTPPRGA